MNKLQLMRQQLERDEKRRRRKELLMFLGVIACCVGIVLPVWLAVKYFDLNKYHGLYLNEGLVFSLIGLAIVAYLVYFVIKGIKTGELRTTTNGGSSYITKRKNKPKMFWFFVGVNLIFVFAILFGIFYWVFIGAGILKANHELFNAVRQLDIEAVEQAIADGANINAKSSGLASLHLATIQGQHRISELLIASGADVNAKSDESGTPLHYAANHGNKEIAELLIAAGVDVNAKSFDGRTPLHLATSNNHIDIAKLLIAKGSDVNAQDEGGRTILHDATGYGHKEVVKLLIAKEADLNAKVLSGKYKDQTPLDIAIELQHPEIAELLRKHGGKTAEELKAEGK